MTESWRRRGLAEVAVEEAAPVVEVLGVERGVEAVGVAEGGEIAGGGAFAEHLGRWGRRGRCG